MEKTIFSCPLCNRVFKLKHHLKAHLQKKNPCITKKEKYLGGAAIVANHISEFNISPHLSKP